MKGIGAQRLRIVRCCNGSAYGSLFFLLSDDGDVPYEFTAKMDGGLFP